MSVCVCIPVYVYMSMNELDVQTTFLDVSVVLDIFSLTHGRERDTSSDNSTSCGWIYMYIYIT